MMKTLTTLLAAALGLGAPAFASAQSAPRFHVSLNGAAQPASTDLSEHFTFEENAEEATVDVRYPSKTGTVVDGAFGVRLWKQFGAGIAVSYASSSGTAEIDAGIPHPFVFGQPRAISGTESGATRAETGTHAQLLFFVPSSGKLRFVLAGGPSKIDLQQDVVTEVHYSDTYPYDTASFTRATTRQAKGSAVGFNVSADVTWMLGRNFGVGGLVRFTRATIDIDTADTRSVSVQAGGLQAGGGVRIAF
jgi:hypothetical protein